MDLIDAELINVIAFFLKGLNCRYNRFIRIL